MLITIILSKEQKHETTQTLPIAEHSAGRFANHISPFIIPVMKSALNSLCFLRIGGWRTGMMSHVATNMTSLGNF